MALRNEPHRNVYGPVTVLLGYRDGASEDLLTKEDTLCVVIDGTMPDITDDLLGAVDKLLNLDVILWLTAPLPCC